MAFHECRRLVEILQRMPAGLLVFSAPGGRMDPRASLYSRAFRQQSTAGRAVSLGRSRKSQNLLRIRCHERSLGFESRSGIIR